MSVNNKYALWNENYNYILRIKNTNDLLDVMRALELIGKLFVKEK